MENFKLPISAIICFNSGSAGDMLVALCLSQLHNYSNFFLDTNGAINLERQYFKQITQQIYYKNLNQSDIEFSNVNPIENTHYYLDFYTSIAKQIYYIDYPDSYQIKILESVKKKRHNDSWEDFLEFNKEFLPEFAKQKVTIDNMIDIFLARWNRNLSGWKNNPHIIPVNFLDFFNATKIQAIVEKIIQRPLTDPNVFLTIWQSWLEKNQNLILT
jgi:hypothetical protein